MPLWCHIKSFFFLEWRGLAKCWRRLTRGRRGVRQLLTIADEGGGGVWKPPKLAAIICGQPLIMIINIIIINIIIIIVVFIIIMIVILIIIMTTGGSCPSGGSPASNNWASAFFSSWEVRWETLVIIKHSIIIIDFVIFSIIITYGFCMIKRIAWYDPFLIINFQCYHFHRRDAAINILPLFLMENTLGQLLLLLLPGRLNSSFWWWWSWWRWRWW